MCAPRQFALTVLLCLLLFVACGCAGSPASAGGPPQSPGASRTTLELCLAEEHPGPGLREAAVSDSQRVVYLHLPAAISAADLRRASRTVDNEGLPAISITLTPEGGRKLAALTSENVGKTLAVIVNGEVINAPTIRSKISEHALITGNFTDEEVERLVAGLNGDTGN